MFVLFSDLSRKSLHTQSLPLKHTQKKQQKKPTLQRQVALVSSVVILFQVLEFLFQFHRVYLVSKVLQVVCPVL